MITGLFNRNIRGSADGSAIIYDPYYAPAVPPGGHIIYSKSPVKSQLRFASSTMVTDSAVVSRHQRRTGWRAQYTYGSVDQKPNLTPPFSGPNSGRVQSSFFQTRMSQLVAWTFNDGLFRAGGYPQNLGFSFRVPRLQTMYAKNSGGPTTGMRQKGIFTKVQTIPRFDSTPQSYNTISARR